MHFLETNGFRVKVKFERSMFCARLSAYTDSQDCVSVQPTRAGTIGGHCFKRPGRVESASYSSATVNAACEEEKLPERPRKTETISLGVTVFHFEKVAMRLHYLARLGSRSHSSHQSNTLLLWRPRRGGSRWRARHRHRGETLHQRSFLTNAEWKKKRKKNVRGSCFWNATWNWYA